MLAPFAIALARVSTSMPHAKLTVDLPEASWIHEVSTAYPETRFSVTTALLAAGRGIVLLELDTPNLVSLVSEMDTYDDVAVLELLWKHDSEALLQVETTDPQLLVPVWRAGVPLETPFVIADGQATWELTTSTERLSALRQALEERGVTFTIESVTGIESNEADRLLTERQREVMLAAREAGYYDDPRNATLTEVADGLGVSKATVSDVLHRAESRLVDWFFEEQLAATGAA